MWLVLLLVREQRLRVRVCVVVVLLEVGLRGGSRGGRGVLRLVVLVEGGSCGGRGRGGRRSRLRVAVGARVAGTAGRVATWK